MSEHKEAYIAAYRDLLKYELPESHRRAKRNAYTTSALIFLILSTGELPQTLSFLGTSFQIKASSLVQILLAVSVLSTITMWERAYAAYYLFRTKHVSMIKWINADIDNAEDPTEGLVYEPPEHIPVPDLNFPKVRIISLAAYSRAFIDTIIPPAVIFGATAWLAAAMKWGCLTP